MPLLFLGWDSGRNKMPPTWQWRSGGKASDQSVCGICGKRFKSVAYMKVHILTHTGEKPYKCSVCGKGFLTNSDRSRHLRLHTGEKPYKCEICYKTFTQNAHLKNHKMTHFSN